MKLILALKNVLFAEDKFNKRCFSRLKKNQKNKESENENENEEANRQQQSGHCYGLTMT